MGVRSRKRRARLAWLVPWVMVPVRAVVARVQRARPRRAYRLAQTLGTLFRWSGVTRAVVRRNLALACGRPLHRAELRRFEARYYRHLGLLLVELLRQPRLTLEDLGACFAPEGIAEARRLFAEGAGVIFVAGHSGVWELAGHAAGLVGIPLTSVAKLSGFPDLDALVLGLRQAGGQRIRDVRGSMWAMKKALDRREAVGINVDQEARQGTVFAPFFGIPAATSSAPAHLHLKTGAPIAVVVVHREAPYRYTLRILDTIRHPPTDDRQADLAAITRRINLAMEEGIRRHPEQWLWSHRRWRRRPAWEETPFARTTDAAPLALDGAEA